MSPTITTTAPCRPTIELAKHSKHALTPPHLTGRPGGRGTAASKPQYLAAHRHAPAFHWDLTTHAPVHEQQQLRNMMAHSMVYGLPSSPPPLPDATQWATALARGIVEMRLGTRPVTQLRRWVVTSLYLAIERTIPQTPTTKSRICRSTSCHIQQVKKGVFEAVVLVEAADGRHTVAQRLEEFRGRWITTALDIL